MAGSGSGQDESNLALWSATRAGKMELPVARPLGIESLLPSNNAIFSSIFSLFWGKTLTKMFGKLSTFT